VEFIILVYVPHCSGRPKNLLELELQKVHEITSLTRLKAIEARKWLRTKRCITNSVYEKSMASEPYAALSQFHFSANKMALQRTWTSCSGSGNPNIMHLKINFCLNMQNVFC